MSAESPRHVRTSGGGPLTVSAQPPSDRSLIDAVSGFINDVTLSSSSNHDPKDVIQWARFETADINEPTPEGDSDNEISPLLLILGYGSGVQVWLVPPTGEAQEVLSWRQGTVRVLRILPTPQHGDCYASKRPLIALCDSASPGPSFCSLSFISIRGGEQVKSIKFKNPILDVLANKRSVIVSFSERFAVFDAATLEDRMAITTCYPCPCPLGGSAPINPLTLGDRWLAYADKKLNQSKRSSGGCEGEGQTSYTATVLHAAKSLSKGLRGLGESVAHSLAGGRSTSQSPSPPSADCPQPGVITVLDVEGNEDEDGQDSEEPYDPIVAHFVAHSEAIIALKFDASGMLLVTADRRGHDFHVFKINPHPCGSSLASVHHLYILHRGDTTAKVQDIAISPDSRWAAISTLRGTTHIFAMSSYGGACGLRTHTSLRVVNRLSRFHRSAGLPIHPHAHTSGSPVSEGAAGAWFPNPRLPPYPIPTVNSPLAQLRPTANLPTHTITRTSSGRQRLSSLSEDSNTVPLLARARFGIAPVGATPGAPGAPGGTGSGAGKSPATHALYLMSPTGCLSHIALHPRPARNVPKEKICDESPIELEVEGIAQWPLQRPPAAADLLAPLPPNSPLLQPLSCRRCADMCMSEEERWLSQVEIVTHAGPHRRLWMGPQFVFKTYNCTGSNSSLSEAETVEVDTSAVARSNPVNMPAARPIVPVLIDSGSASSLEHSPSDSFRRKCALAESGRAASVCDVQLKEDLAEAMKEDHGWRELAASPSCGGGSTGGAGAGGVSRLVDPLGTVLAGRAASPPPAPPDADDYTRSNEDEARFRPVVRAPAALPPPAALLLRPLPRTTTIPVQTLAEPCPSPVAPVAPPRALSTAVIIPAALTDVDDWHVSNALHEPADEPEPEPCFEDCEPAFGKCAAEKPPPPPRVAPPAPAPTLSDTLPASDATVSADLPREKKNDKVKKQVAAAEVKISDDNVAPKPVATADKVQMLKESKCTKTPDRREPSIKESKPTKRDPTAKLEKSAPKENAAAADQTAKMKDTSKIKLDEKYACVTDVACVDSINVDFKTMSVGEDLKLESDERKHESARERGSVPVERERERDNSKSLPKSNRSPDDIQPAACVRVNKSPTLKSVSDRDSEVSSKEKNEESKEVKPKEFKKTNAEKEPKEIKKEKDEKNQRGAKGIKDVKEALGKKEKYKVFKNFDKFEDIKIDKVSEKDDEVVTEEESSVSVNLKTMALKDTKPISEDDIKTEEQAWDMLLSEPDKLIAYSISHSPVDDKPKSKRNKKIKKTQEESQSSREDDSFVEIHAIEESAQQPSSGELVSISTPFEDIDTTSLYLPKTKKRLSKSLTPEKKEESKPIKVLPLDASEDLTLNSKILKKYNAKPNVEILAGCMHVQKDNNMFKDSISSKYKMHYDGTSSESSSFLVKETLKSSKSKSLSPYKDFRKPEKPIESEKDVYVINTAEEEFPEIQITTRAPKPRKRSPLLIEKNTVENEPEIEKPIKSWSSIAASKNVKKVEEDENNVEAKIYEQTEIYDGQIQMSSTASLQEKLFELCKRTDIMVAECDAPSELNFVEEHHAAVLQDLPPLEPLDFGLDEFKLEVMRDSLLEVNDAKLTSPICKINIDDILSSIKETTAKAIESSVFNLIDLEKVPAKKEKGFSVIAEQKITSQDVKLDEKESEIMEKSSEDDTSPVVSTDSDKDEKRTAGAGASNLVLPLLKQSAKSKKSRRKKK